MPAELPEPPVLAAPDADANPPSALVPNAPVLAVAADAV
jgi:hypothetical protein